MKKMMLACAMLLGVTAAAGAQESRQDVSISGTYVFAPDVYGQLVHPLHTTTTLGALVSYRYLLTPRSGLELNYSFAQNSEVFNSVTDSGRVHARQQEISAAYVYSRTYHNYSPFLEGGIAGVVFTPIFDEGGTTKLDTKSNTRVGGLFGGGLAYEISPSFDIRAEYRAIALKAPDFSRAGFTTNRYYVVSTPSIGIAYHF